MKHTYPFKHKTANTTTNTNSNRTAFSQKQYLLLSVIFFLIAFWMFAASDRINDEAIARAISPNILRFHVLAASDSEEDQAVKLQVRDYFLNLLNQELPERADKSVILSYIEEQKTTLEQTLNQFLLQKGTTDTAVIEVSEVYFPERVYGNFVFPCGEYEALRIKIGAANGHNWWCVLYPSLCFTDESGPYLPPSSCLLLEDLVGEGTYETISSQKPNAMNLSDINRNLNSHIMNSITSDISDLNTDIHTEWFLASKWNQLLEHFTSDSP